ncbi:hypothetical protein [Candidatus Ruminimicrobiellum ovillum]|uniref:hypothetical protein n=1 Tax=Candidatus Ruminimicrobiellum ovillum TaxID=1947927 RepID=UPI00355A53AD
MKKNTKKIILTIVGILVFACICYALFSKPYRIERIKVFVNDTISNFTSND